MPDDVRDEGGLRVTLMSEPRLGGHDAPMKRRYPIRADQHAHGLFRESHSRTRYSYPLARSLSFAAITGRITPLCGLHASD
jgi:hypothetical protein